MNWFGEIDWSRLRCSMVSLGDADGGVVVWEAANGPFGVYQRGTRDGIGGGDARWETLTAALTATVERFDLLGAVEWHRSRCAKGMGRRGALKE